VSGDLCEGSCKLHASRAATHDDKRKELFLAGPITFSFGAFIEGAAGFGAPVAVSGAMLAGLGFNPFYAAGICLLANTAPVAFGSIGIPVTTLANVTGLPVLPLSAMVGRLCAMISVIIPGYLIVVMAGGRRALEVLPAILACGLSFAGMQFYVTTGAGLYRENLGELQETHVGFNSGGGAKISLLGPLRARLDYRVFKLRGEPLRPSVVHRVYAGINLAF